jgi:hypothetical protein
MSSNKTSPAVTADDRRASERSPVSKRVHYQIAGGARGEGLCWSLSRVGTGLNLTSSQPVADEGVLIELTFDGSPTPLTARIVWVKEVGALRRMGLVFHEMTEAQRALVEELLR